MKFLSSWLIPLLGVGAVAGCSVESSGRGGTGGLSDAASPATGDDASVAPPEGDSGQSAGIDAGDGAEPDPATPDASTDDATTPVDPPDPRDAVLGAYAARRRFARVEEIRSGAFADDVKQVSTHYTLVEIVKDHSDYLLRERACRTVVSSRGNILTNIEVSIADAVPESLPELESLLEVSATDGTLSFVKALSSAPLGFVAENDADSIPTELDDARVRDGDGDGAPGVSVHVRIGPRLEGEQYIVEWVRTQYQAERDALGNFRGPNFDRSEQRILGTSEGDGALAAPREVRDDEDTAQNTVELVRLPSPLACSELVPRLSELFPE
jgi:hypothetical protein